MQISEDKESVLYQVDGDIITYDVRMVKPNGGVYLETPAMHTIEHLFATFARNSCYSDSVIYVGPMGCRTGFYLILRDTVSHSQAIGLVRDAFSFIADFEGEIPGNKREECGNYLEHDLTGAKAVAADMASVLSDWNEQKLNYEN